SEAVACGRRRLSPPPLACIFAIFRRILRTLQSGLRCSSGLQFERLPQEVRMDLTINDQTVTVAADPDLPLLWVLRDLLGMTGTKFGCGLALCGACTVLIDGQAVRSCVLKATQAAGKKITTIEGVGATPAGAALQEAWQSIYVPQCGYCQAGQIMSAAALL